jgi:hypothetical protein
VSWHGLTAAQVAEHNRRVAAGARAAKGVPAEPVPEPGKWERGKEAEMSRLVVTDLRRRGYVVVVARTDQRSTIAAGFPDLTVLKGNGDTASAVCIELKTAAGKLSKAQVECHDELIRAGVPVAVCRSFDEAVKFAVARLGPVG